MLLLANQLQYKKTLWFRLMMSSQAQIYCIATGKDNFKDKDNTNPFVLLLHLHSLSCLSPLHCTPLWTLGNSYPAAVCYSDPVAVLPAHCSLIVMLLLSHNMQRCTAWPASTSLCRMKVVCGWRLLFFFFCTRIDPSVNFCCALALILFTAAFLFKERCF